MPTHEFDGFSEAVEGVGVGADDERAEDLKPVRMERRNRRLDLRERLVLLVRLERVGADRLVPLIYACDARLAHQVEQFLVAGDLRPRENDEFVSELFFDDPA